MFWTDGVRCHCDSHDYAGYTKTQEVEREVEHSCIPVSRAVTFLHSAMMDGCSSVPRYKQPIPWSIVPAGCASGTCAFGFSHR